MSECLYRRTIVALLLLCAISGCLIWFGATPLAPDFGTFAGNREIVTNYDAYLNRPVVVSGPVVTTDPITIRLNTETGETIDLRVTGANLELSKDDVLSVYGTLQPDQQITATNAVVKPAGNYWRTRILSVLAGLWVLYRGLRHWKPNVRALIIERREKTDA